MTLVRFNGPTLMNKLANDAFFGNLWDSNLETNYNCKSNQVNYIVNEEDASINIEFAIPGLQKSDLEIELNDQILSVKTKESSEGETKSGFASLKFEKRFKLSNKINKDEISAHSENGILYIVLPKHDNAVKKPARAIEIA